MISKHIKLFILIICCIVYFADNSFSEVLRARCPFSCQTQNLPKQFCKDWRKGDSCFIDVVGRVVKRACPFTCKTERINKTDCRDWREGNVCFIHDLRRNSPYRSNINEFQEYNSHHHKNDGYHYRDDYYRDDYHRVPPRDFYKDKERANPQHPKDYFKAPEFPKKPNPPAPRKTTGKVTKRPCPYSCRTEGIPKKKCRDWKEGGLCVIERL